MQTETAPTVLPPPPDQPDEEEEINLGDDDFDEDEFGATGIISSGSSFASDEHHIDSDEESGHFSSDNKADDKNVRQADKKTQMSSAGYMGNRVTNERSISTSHRPPRPRPTSVSTIHPGGFMPRRHPNRVLSTKNTRVTASHDESKPSRIYGSGLNKTEYDINRVMAGPKRQAAIKVDHQQTHVGKTSGGGKLKALRRASMTFYKSFRMPGGKIGTKEKKTNEESETVSEVKPQVRPGRPNLEDMKSPEEMVEEFLSPEKRAEIQRRHEDVIDTIDDELLTLQRLQERTVDLAVCKTVTRRTLDALSGSCLELLGDYGVLEERVEQLVSEIKNVEKQTGAGVAEKERMLIDAKVQLAESQSELLSRRLELANLKRDARAAKKTEEARSAAEVALREKQKILNNERSQVKKLESKVKDMEGDWT